MTSDRFDALTRFSVARLLRMALTALGLVLLLALAANAWIIDSTQARIHDHMDRVGHHAVALVLGTSPYTSSGVPNLLFKHRMLAAAELYAHGKVAHILVSGANPGYYNEPQEMYQALRRLGVPHDAITLDFAGYRTFDSIVRSKRVFGLQSYIIVSQRYHDYRALFTAAHEGMEAVAYVRSEEDLRQPFWTELREYFARVEAVLDLFVWQARPRYLGPPVKIAAANASANGGASACRLTWGQPHYPLFPWQRYSATPTSSFAE